MLSFAISLLIVALVIFAFRAWRRFQAADPLSKLGPGLCPASPNE
jgi:hypothetical protein